MIQKKIIAYAKEFNEKIERFYPAANREYEIVRDAMVYSLDAGGKRLRPFLLKSFYELCGGDKKGVENFEMAIESIHTYSLIHDDLPSMDNDDMRRGKPSCHKKFGEEYALLAGDALLTAAFGIAAGTKDINADSVLKAIGVLSEKSGLDGMVGGQVIDLLNEENSNADINTVSLICKLKTGALIRSACMIGCILANADESKLTAAEEYAEKLGLAFQIVDDILDVVGDEKKLGKPLGSDKENEKVTFVSLLGIEQCKKIVADLTEQAKAALNIFGSDADDLKNLADYLCIRDY